MSSNERSGGAAPSGGDRPSLLGGRSRRRGRELGALTLAAGAALFAFLVSGAAESPGGRDASRRAGPEKTAPGEDPCKSFTCDEGGIVRGALDSRRLSLVFTGGPFGDGGEHIRAVLKKLSIRAGFFFTGDFYRTPEFQGLIRGLAADGHYLGPHSDKHLLYCDWSDRAKTLVTREEFRNDLLWNYREMEKFGLSLEASPYFIPPFEWYNSEIAGWAREMGLVVINFTPGTSSNADYTTPSMTEYLSSDEIYGRILDYERKDPHGLNGFILLIHIGTDPERKDKLYMRLEGLIRELERRGYSFVRVDELLGREERRKD
jgi:peptidoglycan/xylan/chitin deacetylase (PgdA/CDA1 family)